MSVLATCVALVSSQQVLPNLSFNWGDAVSASLISFRYGIRMPNAGVIYGTGSSISASASAMALEMDGLIRRSFRSQVFHALFNVLYRRETQMTGRLSTGSDRCRVIAQIS